MKKAVSLLLTLILLIGMVPAMADWSRPTG